MSILSPPNFISNSSTSDSLFDQAFVFVLSSLSGFDLEEDDLSHISLAQTIEDDIVDAFAYEIHISCFVGKSRKKRSELFWRMSA